MFTCRCKQQRFNYESNYEFLKMMEGIQLDKKLRWNMLLEKTPKKMRKLHRTTASTTKLLVQKVGIFQARS